MKNVALVLFLLVAACGTTPAEKQVYRSDKLEIIRLSANAYRHVSYLQTRDYGNVPCNGMVVTGDKRAVVLDTPTDEASALELIEWIEKTLECEITAVVPTHYHDDNLGGLEAFHRHGIGSYALSRTVGIAREHGYPTPRHPFDSTLRLPLGESEVIVEFLGEGHTCDNVVGYFPSENVLFGGCLIKALDAGKGNLAEANEAEWPETVRKVKTRYPGVRVIVPGHGSPGGPELLDYTLRLFE